MADQQFQYLATTLHGKTRVPSKDQDKPATNHHFKPPEPPKIKQPNFLPDPFLREVKRRPAQLNLSRDMPPPPGPSKPLSAMSVREKLLQGISIDIHRRQKSPASFDRVFPSRLTAFIAKVCARESAKKLLNTPNPDAAELQDDETQEARRFEKQLRNVCV